MDAAWRKLRWFGAYWISVVAIQLGRVLPARFWYALAVPAADFCFLLLTRHRRNLIENLRRVVGDEEARAAARRAFRNFGRYVIDFYQLPVSGQEALHRRIRFDEWEALDGALDEAVNGTIFVTLHLGQAELGGAALSTYRHPITVVAEDLEYGPMNRFIQGLRSSLGMKIVPAKKGKLNLMRCLARGEVTALMFDAVKPGEGITVSLLGEPAEVSSAPARIALRSGARILPAIVRRAEDDARYLIPDIDFDFSFEPTGDDESDVPRLTQAIAAALERFIRAYPDQWFAFRPVWPDTKRPEKEDAGAELWKQWALALAVKLGARLPERIAYGCARLAGDLAFHLRAPTRADVEDNMRHVLGPHAPPAEVRRQAREVFRNVARYYVDLVRLPIVTPERLRTKLTRLHHFERLAEPLHASRGVVVATAHYGNPEMAVQVGSVLGLDVLVLAEPLRPPSFARLMKRVRSAFGARYEDVGFGTIARAIRHLRGGGCLAITCDRAIQGTGVPLPFFGESALMPLGAVELAARTGALIVPGYCRRSGDTFDIYFEEPLDMEDTGDARRDAIVNARALLARAEAWIEADPGQWMPLERIWRRVDAPIESEAAGATPDGAPLV